MAEYDGEMMPRYSQEDLLTIAEALWLKGFQGLSTTVRWWNSEPFKRKGPRYQTIMRSPLKDMPLYINDESESIRIIATERLKLRR